MSKEELKCASDEVLKQSTSGDSNSRMFDIDVPPAVTEFPEYANNATKVYPLPISHEKQVKIVGVAGNLDLFDREFNFKSGRDKKYLPLHTNGKSLI